MPAAWPNLAPAAADVWPVVEDLRKWMRDESVEPTKTEMVDLSFNAANQLVRDRIDVDLFKCKAERAGLVTDPDDDAYDEAALHAWCPQYVHQAILIEAAWLYVQRDSANGTINFGDFATFVQDRLPAVRRELLPVVLPGIA